MNHSLNLSDIPATADGIKNLSPMVRFRVALQLGIMPSDQDAIAAFSALHIDKQIEMLLPELMRVQQSGALGGAAPPPPQNQPPRTPSGAAPGQMGQPPGQMGAPGQMAPAGYAAPAQAPGQMGAPAGFQQQAAPQQGNFQFPAAGGAPGQMGAGPTTNGFQPAPGQMGAPSQMSGAAPQQPPRTPMTVSDPTGGLPAGAPAPLNQQLLQILTSLSSGVSKLQKTIDEEVPGAGDLQEVLDAILGLTRTNQTIGIMVLMLLENASAPLSRDMIFGMIREEIQNATAVTLISSANPEEQTQGKA